MSGLGIYFLIMWAVQFALTIAVCRICRSWRRENVKLRGELIEARAGEKKVTDVLEDLMWKSLGSLRNPMVKKSRNSPLKKRSARYGPLDEEVIE